jgi:hypothetical protein
VTIRQRVYDSLSPDVVAGTGPVLNDELLTKPLRKPLAHHARGDVDRSARGKADDQAYRLRRIGLRSCDD